MQEQPAWDYGIHVKATVNGQTEEMDVEEVVDGAFSWLLVEDIVSPAVIKPMIKQSRNVIVQYDIRRLQNGSIPWENELEMLSAMGVTYIQPGDNPNLKRYYQNIWGKQSVLERFYCLFQPFAKKCVSLGFKVVFPLLLPGGDYWDTVFLRSILNRLIKDGEENIISSLVLSANGATFERALDWGKGGAGRWSQSRPYHTPDGSEDHIGMNTWQWYAEIATEVVDKELPIFVFHCGETILGGIDDSHLEISEIVKRFPRNRRKPSDLINVCFWSTRVVVDFLIMDAGHGENETTEKMIEQVVSNPAPCAVEEAKTSQLNEKWINEYVFLPMYEWGVADWHFDIVKPYIKENHATLGFSLAEASQAKRVLMVAVTGIVPESEIQSLRDVGCEVTVLNGDGTEIAQQLAAR